MITPQQAQELLDGTVPGPWLCEKDGDEHEFVIGTEDFGIITEVNRESDGRLIAAAPALAELVANMRYEYAVQVEERPGVWRYLHSSGESTGFSIAACWCKNFEMAPYPLAKYRHRETTPSRIVRRLVSDVEVVA